MGANGRGGHVLEKSLQETHLEKLLSLVVIWYYEIFDGSLKANAPGKFLVDVILAWLYALAPLWGFHGNSGYAHIASKATCELTRLVELYYTP